MLRLLTLFIMQQGGRPVPSPSEAAACQPPGPLIQRALCAETDELKTLESCPGGPEYPIPAYTPPTFFHSRRRPNPLLLLSCKIDGPAKLCSIEDACDTEKMPRGNFKELDWVS